MEDQAYGAEPMAPVETDAKMVSRDAPEPDAKRLAFLNRWCSRVKAAELHWKPIFDQMRKDQEYARNGCDASTWDASTQYTANIMQRHLNQRVASLYAKNPRAVAKRRPRLDFAIWDGDQQTLATAATALATGLAIPGTGDPSEALVADVQQAMTQRKMLDKVAKTLEILFHYFMDEQSSGFKKRMKRMVRRTATTGVGYLKLDFQRIMERQPDVERQLADVTNLLAKIEAMSADLADGEFEQDSAKAEELRAMIGVLQGKKDIIVREGLVFNFPRSTDIIIDPACTELMGFVGAGWIAHKFHLSTDRIQETYGKDVKRQYTGYHEKNGRMEVVAASDDTSAGDACVYEIQDKESGMVFTICEGYNDYLREPDAPGVEIERFFNIFSLTFNDVEDEKSIFPNSDVFLLRSMQDEYNRSRQGLREHRQSNRPRWATMRGSLEEKDKNDLSNAPPFSVIEFSSVTPDRGIADLVQPIPTAPIDPAAYDVNPIFEDVLRTVGSQEANLGGTSGGTATESSIAEGSRITSVQSNIDDLDDFLTDIARCSGQVLLAEMSPEIVTKIAGPGAAWPQLNRQDIAEEIGLQIKAGSSGRPNKAQELANFERAAPTLLQIPGVSPVWLARKALERLDDDLDLDEAIIEGIPSIIAMNTAQSRPQPSTGDPATDPAQQGGQGGNNAPAAQQRQDGPQPKYPEPSAAQGAA